VQMLRLTYGVDAMIRIQNKQKQGAIVRLSLPSKLKSSNKG
jgi:hypothetical protein